MKDEHQKYTFYEEKEYVSRIRSRYDAMNENERKIADYFLQKETDCLSQTVREMADSIGSSTASIIRFCRGLGYNGLSDMKFHMKQNILTLDSSHIALRSSDQGGELKQKVISLVSNSMMESAMRTDDAAINRAIDMILASSHIYLFGSGTASGAVSVALSMFLSMGLPAYTISDNLLQLKTIAYMKPEDLIICIDYSGYLKDISDVLMAARERQVPSILITGTQDTLNESYADVCLYTATRNERNALNFAITAMNELALLLIIQTGVFLRLEQPKQHTETLIKQYDHTIKSLDNRPMKQ